MQKIVVTGGAGMIGSNLCKRLSASNCYVYNIDNLSGGGVYGSHRENFIYCDISNREKLFDIMKSIKPDLIFHCAAHFANQNSVDYPRSDIKDNLEGLVNVLDFAKLVQARVVYASSSCVYGKNSQKMSEDTQLNPHDTPYAINKYTGELYCKYYSSVFNLRTNIIRIFNTYGPGELPGAYRNVIPNFIKTAVLGDKLEITGTGEETRDFTFVDDTIDLLIKASQSSYWDADVFNGGTGNATKIIDLAHKIKKIVGSDSEIIFKGHREWDHVTQRLAEITKSKQVLGYNPTVNLNNGLQATYEWLKLYI